MFRFVAILSAGLVSVALLTPIKARAQSAEALLTRDLGQRIRPMAKEIRLYHYFQVRELYDNLKTPEGRGDNVSKYLNDVTRRFWDLNFHADQYINAGPGVYLAIEPYAAYLQRNIFGTSMLEIRVPKGASYFSVGKTGNGPVNGVFPLEDDTVLALVREGYFAQHQLRTFFTVIRGSSKYGFSRDTLKNMTDPGFEKFRSLFQKIVSDQGIQFIEYNWLSKLEGFCKNATRSTSAFVYIGSRTYDHRYDGVPYTSVSFVYPNLNSAEAEMAGRTSKYRSVLEMIDGLRAAGRTVPKDLIVPNNYTAAEYKQIKDMTFNCD